MRVLLAVAVMSLLVAVPRLASSQLSLSFNPDVQNGAPGDTVTFSGTLTNIGSNDLFLNGAGVDLVGTGITFDSSKFLLNTPPLLGAGETTGSVELFDVFIDASANPGTYAGTFTVTGGSDALAQDDLATQSFTVNVTPAAVPEPGAWAMVICGMMSSVTWAALRRHRARRRSVTFG